jgi:hypothetical protein
MTRLPNVRDVTRHRKHDPYTDARRKRDDALLRHPHIPAAEPKKAGPDGDPNPYQAPMAIQTHTHMGRPPQSPKFQSPSGACPDRFPR